MAASKCLVAYGDKNVVVTFHGPWTKENLTEHVKTSKLFEGLHFSAMSLKVSYVPVTLYDNPQACARGKWGGGG